jgi:hypothetical protein
MTEREEKETAEPTREYVVSYWVNFCVDATDEEDATAKAEAELMEALENGSIGDYVSDSCEVYNL